MNPQSKGVLVYFQDAQIGKKIFSIPKTKTNFQQDFKLVSILNLINFH